MKQRSNWWVMMFGAGKVKPVANATLPLAGAAETHRLMESAGHKGKIILSR